MKVVLQMKQKSPRKRHCIYSECYLSENNNAYLIQIIYAVITVIILGANRQAFSLVNILLFIAPFLVDLTQNSMKSKLYKIVKGVMITVNVLLLIFAISGIFLIEESELCFTIKETAIVCGGLIISKQLIFYMCLSNVIVPALLYLAVPCKKNIKSFEEIENTIQNTRYSNMEEQEVST